MTQLSLFEENNKLTEIEEMSRVMASCKTMEELSIYFCMQKGITHLPLYYNFDNVWPRYTSSFLTYFKDNTAYLSNIAATTPPKESAQFDFYDRRSNYHGVPEYKRDLLFCDQSGQVWKSTFTLVFTGNITYFHNDLKYPRFYEPVGTVKQWSFTPWRKFNKYPLYKDSIILNSDQDLSQIMQKNRPYTAEWMHSVNYHNYMTLLCCPQLEQLYKAGYAFAEEIINYKELDQIPVSPWSKVEGNTEKAVHAFNMLCKPGTKPKDIFQTEKPVYSTLKNEKSLQTWNRFRLLFKQGKIKADTVEQVYHAGFDDDILKQISSILNHTYEGKAVFNWNTLLNYLNRLDMYEAISASEAIPLLLDVLRMSDQLNVKPNITGDSLKREHDVLARTCRQKRNEILAAQMTGACKKLEKFDYAESIYFIRGIRSYDDLLDEARQQHNCVASYAQSIINGNSLIYVMREKNNPDKSLITIELTPKSTEIRQKYLAFNQPIRNKSQSEFIDRWLNCVRQCRKEKADSIQILLDSGFRPDRQNPALQPDGMFMYCSTTIIDLQNYIACNAYPDNVSRFASPISSNGQNIYGTVTFSNALSKDKMEKLNLLPGKIEYGMEKRRVILPR